MRSGFSSVVEQSGIYREVARSIPAQLELNVSSKTFFYVKKYALVQKKFIESCWKPQKRSFHFYLFYSYLFLITYFTMPNNIRYFFFSGWACKIISYAGFNDNILCKRKIFSWRKIYVLVTLIRFSLVSIKGTVHEFFIILTIYMFGVIHCYNDDDNADSAT